jgi:ribosome biogenesis GTPase / thiamine phosphate phosphatase
MNLEKLGFDQYFKEQFQSYQLKGLYPARVISQQKNNYQLCWEDGVVNGRLAGKFKHEAMLKKDMPVVGDWVALHLIDNNSQSVIHAVLPRKNYFSRKMTISGGRKMKNGILVGGSIEEQVIASNVDTAFIVSGLDENFNLQRIERYVTLVYNSKVNPVILLNKMDLCENVEEYKTMVEKIAIDIDVYPISVTANKGMEVFKPYLSPGKTVVFFGSSGVGKSTLTNYLLGEQIQKTKEISGFSGKGQHTTTGSQLFLNNSGAMIIDTPGLKQLQLWGDEETLNDSFKDIVEIVEGCKYRDCSHEKEPGCALRQAVEDGILSAKRFESYKDQQGELQRLGKNKKQFEVNMQRKAKYKY